MAVLIDCTFSIQTDHFVLCFSLIRQNGEKRLKGVQLAFPILTGTIAFSLGKKVRSLLSMFSSFDPSTDVASQPTLTGLRVCNSQMDGVHSISHQ